MFLGNPGILGQCCMLSRDVHGIVLEFGDTLDKVRLFSSTHYHRKLGTCLTCLGISGHD